MLQTDSLSEQLGRFSLKQFIKILRMLPALEVVKQSNLRFRNERQEDMPIIFGIVNGDFVVPIAAIAADNLGLINLRLSFPLSFPA